jgi:hypothetical protein
VYCYQATESSCLAFCTVVTRSGGALFLAKYSSSILFV